jgi:heme/copper-type cytochrome/quinol oxidase subunit 1
VGLNPYAAPSAEEQTHEPIGDDTRGMARGAVVLARAWLVVVGVGLVLGVATAIARRFLLHGSAMTFAVMMPAIYGLFPTVIAAERIGTSKLRTLPLAWLGLVLWASGATTVIAIAATSDGWTFYDPRPSTTQWIGPSLVAMGMLLTTVHVLALLVSSSGVAVGRRLLVLALAALLAERALGVALTTTILTRIAEVEGMWGPRLLDLVPALIAMGWAIAREPEPRWRSPVIVLAFATMAATIGLGVVLSVLRRIDDVHLADTLVYTSVGHLHGAIVLFALVAVVLASASDLFGRPAHRVLAWIGSTLFAGGVLGHVIALLVLGARGMPRRYITYPEIFAGWQRAASAATAVIAIGALVLVLALLAGRRRPALLG